jgi:hypothetical protein
MRRFGAPWLLTVFIADGLQASLRVRYTKARANNASPPQLSIHVWIDLWAREVAKRWPYILNFTFQNFTGSNFIFG